MDKIFFAGVKRVVKKSLTKKTLWIAVEGFLDKTAWSRESEEEHNYEFTSAPMDGKSCKNAL
jgi:hypothetical protein